MLDQSRYVVYGCVLTTALYVMYRISIWFFSLRFPYELRPSILTPAEKSILVILEAVSPEGHKVFCKVRLSDVIRPRSGLSSTRRKRAYTEGHGRTLDFVVCDGRTLKPLAAVKIGGAELNRTFIKKACGKVGLPIVEVLRKKDYGASDLQELEDNIRRMLGR